MHTMKRVLAISKQLQLNAPFPTNSSLKTSGDCAAPTNKHVTYPEGPEGTLCRYPDSNCQTGGTESCTSSCLH